jgi:hypothetical protein
MQRWRGVIPIWAPALAAWAYKLAAALSAAVWVWAVWVSGLAVSVLSFSSIRIGCAIRVARFNPKMLRLLSRLPQFATIATSPRPKWMRLRQRFGGSGERRL